MKKQHHIFIGLALVLTAGLVTRAVYAEGEPLPLAEVGSAEAEQLNRAYESDLQGAVESPEEAAQHQKALDRETGRRSSPPPAQPTPAEQPQSSNEFDEMPGTPKVVPMGGTESDLAPESEPAWLQQGGSPNNPPARSVRRAPPPPPPPASTSSHSHGADLAPESEPAWLKQGGNPNNPPAGRARRASSPAAARPQVSVDTASQKINTPPFIFNPWSANLSDSDRAVLEQIAQLMKDRPADIPRLKIEAYTDNSGDPAINESLTVARANVVKAYLILKGVGVHRLEALGLGEKSPIASNDSKSGRAKNRRVEFKIAK